MSKYTNYEKVSQTYDELRHAGHVDTMTNVVCGVLRKKPEDVSKRVKRESKWFLRTPCSYETSIFLTDKFQLT